MERGLEMMEAIGTETCAASGLEAAVESWDEAEAGLDSARDEGPGVGLPYEAFLNPMELKLAHKIVDGLEPGDPQEEIHAWHLAVTHIFAAERIGKARQPDLPLRPQQIEMGLAVRIMTLCDRKSAALDRHRAMKQKAAREERREAEQKAEAAAREAETLARERAREAAKAAEDAAREERMVLRDQYWEARRQERLEEAAARGESDSAPPEGPPEGPPAAGTERDP